MTDRQEVTCPECGSPAIQYEAEATGRVVMSVTDIDPDYRMGRYLVCASAQEDPNGEIVRVWCEACGADFENSIDVIYDQAPEEELKE